MKCLACGVCGGCTWSSAGHRATCGLSHACGNRMGLVIAGTIGTMRRGSDAEEAWTDQLGIGNEDRSQSVRSKKAKVDYDRWAGRTGSPDFGA